MRRIDFFLIGAPKCGTDSLRAYLAAAPGAFLTGPEEPNYFCTDLRPPSYDVAAHLARHFGRAPRAALWGEKSTWYLHSEAAPREILAHNPEARFVALTRAPVAQFLSLHGELVRLGAEPCRDPATAWRASLDRDPRAPGLARLLHYPTACALGPALARWRAAVGARLYATTLERLVAEPEEPRRICAFLGLAPPKGALPHANRARGPGIALGPRPMALAGALKARLGIRSFGVGRALAGMGAPRPRPTLPPELREEIAATLAGIWTSGAWSPAPSLWAVTSGIPQVRGVTSRTAPLGEGA